MMKCCFIGHRKINLTKELEQKLSEIIEDLILFNDVKIFNFGSKSEFNDICHRIVTNFRDKYPDIKRISYTCMSESCILEKEREYWEKLYSSFKKSKINLLGVEDEIEYKAKYSSGKASYIERNYSMIDSSDYCIFYYDKDYVPERKSSKNEYIIKIAKSGTKIAYDYAKRKNKIVINILDY